MSNWSYQKIIFTALIGFAAVVGGVWVGGALFQQEPLAIQAADLGSDYAELDARFASFTVGDHFPWEDFMNPDGSQGDFDVMRGDSPALYIFSSTTCEPCLVLLSHLQKIRAERLQPEVKVVVCVPADLQPVSEDFVNLTAGMALVYIERAYWAAEYQIAFWPTIVAVDGDGFVQHIQFGYPNEIDMEIQRYFYRSN